MTISNVSGKKQSGADRTQFRENNGSCDDRRNQFTERFGVALRFFGKPWPKNILRIAVTAAFVYFVNRSVSGSDIAQMLHEVRLGPMAAAVLLGALSYLLQVLRWQLILRSNALPCSLSVSTKTMLRGSLLAFITPGRIGELFRALHLDRTRRLTTITAVVEERLFAVVMTVVAGIICLALQAVVYRTAPFIPVAMASGLFCGMLIFAMVAVGLKLPVFPRRESGAFSLKGPVTVYLRHIRTLPHIPLSLLSVGAHLLLLVQTAVLFRMFGSGGVVQELLVAGQAFSFMLLLPFFIANIGLREYAFALFLGRSAALPLTPAQLPGIALGVGTSILIINIIIPAILGLIWLYTEKKTASGLASAPMSGDAAVAPATPEFHDDAI